MQALLRTPKASLLFSGIAVAGVVVFVLAVGVVMQPAAQTVGQERLSELTCLQLAFTPDRATEVVLGFPAEARPSIQQLLIPGDMMLAWGYGLTLFGLLGLLVVRLPTEWQAAGRILMWAPLVATLLDCTENLFLYSIAGKLVADPEAIVPLVLPLFGSLCASLKYIALSVITPAFAVVGTVKAISVDRRIGSWVVYLLLTVTALSMVSRPLQSIPACF